MIKNFVKILELLGDRLEVCVSVLTDFLFPGETSKAARGSLRLNRVFVLSTFILPLFEYVPIKFEFVRCSVYPFPSVRKIT